MENNLFKKNSLVTIFSLVAVLSLLMVAVTPAFAKATEPTGAVSGGAVDSRSVAMFHHALTVYNNTIRTRIYENNTLDAALQYVHSRENKVGTPGGKGYGAFSPNQFATLYAYFNQLTYLTSQINALLLARPGFDKYGQVTNSALAADTAKTIDGMAKSLQYYTIKANALYSTLQHSR